MSIIFFKNMFVCNKINVNGLGIPVMSSLTDSKFRKKIHFLKINLNSVLV